MPREPEIHSSPKRTESGVRSRNRTESATWVELSPDLKESLRSWVDVDEVGPVGFLAWLQSIVPVIPRRVPLSRSKGSPDPATRIAELAAALVECSGDRARVHFDASEYFRENQVLARRVKALEAILRTERKHRDTRDVVPPDPEAERAAERYLPTGNG